VIAGGMYSGRGHPSEPIEGFEYDFLRRMRFLMEPCKVRGNMSCVKVNSKESKKLVAHLQIMRCNCIKEQLYRAWSSMTESSA
jgi:hypothetical protein